VISRVQDLIDRGARPVETLCAGDTRSPCWCGPCTPIAPRQATIIRVNCRWFPALATRHHPIPGCRCPTEGACSRVQSRSILSLEGTRWLSDNAQRIRDDTRQSPTPHRRRHLGLHPLHGADPHTEGLDLRQTAGPTRPRSTALVTPPLRGVAGVGGRPQNVSPGGQKTPLNRAMPSY
jgi:hypothetical protein